MDSKNYGMLDAAQTMRKSDKPKVRFKREWQGLCPFCFSWYGPKVNSTEKANRYTKAAFEAGRCSECPRTPTGEEWIAAREHAHNIITGEPIFRGEKSPDATD